MGVCWCGACDSLEQSSCVAVVAETLLTAEHCSVMSAGTARPGVTEAHRAYQLAEGRYWTEVLHEVVSKWRSRYSLLRARCELTCLFVFRRLDVHVSAALSLACLSTILVGRTCDLLTRR